ncbi:MAG: metal ABC transporter permease [Promethearchaeota archaeon]
MGNILDFFEDLVHPWVMRPLLTSIIIGAVCGLVGVFMVLRKLVFLGNGIAHSAFAGGALGPLVGLAAMPELLLPVSSFAFLTALIVGFVNKRAKVSNETAIGILFSVNLALGVIFVNMYEQYNVAIQSLLFGSISSITIEELTIVILFSITILSLLFSIMKPLYFSTFDEEMAKASGMPTIALTFTFLLIIALTVIMCITTVGIILVMAFIVTPAASAYQFTYKLRALLIYSTIIATTGSFVGFMIAYVFNLSGGATIALVLTAIFGVSITISPKRRLKLPDVDQKYCKVCENMVKDVDCRYCDLEAIELEHQHKINNHTGHPEEKLQDTPRPAGEKGVE